MNNTKYSSLTNLLSSIVFLIIGAMLFNNPGEIIITISKIIGLILSIIGLFKIVLFIRKRNKELPVKNIDLATSIALLIIGLLFIFLAGAFETALRFILGAWILLNGINKLISIIALGSDHNNFASMIIISIILILLGGYIILVSNLVISAIGLMLMIYSIIEIASYIIYKVSNEKHEQHENNEKPLDELKTPSKDIKDAKYIEKK